MMATPHQFHGFQFPTTTPVPDELFDVLLPQLNGAELKVLLYICRRTLGFKKQSDNISLHQIATGIKTRDGRVLDRGTGLCKAAVVTAVRSLEKKGIISKTRRQSVENGCEPTTYSLNFALHQTGEGFGPLAKQQTGACPETSPLAKKQTGGCLKTKQGLVQKLDTQQTVLQETDNVVVDDVLQQLETFGIAKAAATKLTQEYPVEYIREKLAMAAELVGSGSALVAKNPAGWLRRAIEEDYTAPRQLRTAPPENPTAQRVREEAQTAQHAGSAAAVAKSEAREAACHHRPAEQPPESEEGGTPASVWNHTLKILKEQVPAATFATWLKDTALLNITDRAAKILVPSSLAVTWLEKRLYWGIVRALRDVLHQDVEVQFVTRPGVTAA
jgi:hypothetical protein